LKYPGSTFFLAVCLVLATGCGEERTWECDPGASESSEYLSTIGCLEDFEFLASQPLDSSIPGARSGKLMIDRVADNTLYFQNSNLYPTHYAFASTHLSGNGLPVIPMLSDFNLTEYSSNSRRLVLGAITYYEGPDVYTYEIAPYDTADAEMVSDAYKRIVDKAFFGKRLFFHPTSDAVESMAKSLPSFVKVITTEELFAGIDFQALNTGVSYGQIGFATAAELDTDVLSFRDIAVLDSVPNDISVVMGIITSAFQTPLSHVNVLSQNRGTPNMALRGAYDDPDLRALEGEWVRLEVGPFDYSVTQVTQQEADDWWEANKPTQVLVPGMDLSVTDLRDIETVIDLDAMPLLDAVKAGTRGYGGKASHYSALARIDGVPAPKAFAIPVYYYVQFMELNGFDTRVAAMIADPAFQNDPQARKDQLTLLRDDMVAAPIDAAFEQLVLDKLAADYPGLRMRFRSSTNAEDLDGFTGAGLYTSKSGDPSDPTAPVALAIQKVWASIWNYRAYEERSFRSIDHSGVGMALLVHRSFTDETANGVALTNNPFDTSGLDPAFYINVQFGEASVVQPAPGVTTDQIIYYFDRPGQPSVYVAHSSRVPFGGTVLTNAQLFELGQSLDKIRSYFNDAYGSTEWWAMDVEFKFDSAAGGEPALFVKQARPFGP
jgi:pyruvate,water dikinase